MKRLTEKYKGKNIVKSGHITFIYGTAGNRFEGEAIDKLSVYEDAEEQGRYGKWIPVSERLPEESLNSVIGWDTYRNRCCFVQYLGGRFVLGDDIYSVNVTAWMPLPEPYRESEVEDGEV